MTSWTKDSRPPFLLETQGIEKTHVNYAYDAISLLFDETVDLNSDFINALTLTRNGKSVDLSGYVQIVSIGGEANRWTVNGLSALTQEEGNYQLKVDLSHITDMAGNVNHEIREFSWKMDTTTPVINVPETAIRSRTGEINLSGTISESDVVIHVQNLSNHSSLGAITTNDVNWNYPITLREEGYHDVLLTVTDRAGNSSEILYSIFIDRTSCGEVFI